MSAVSLSTFYRAGQYLLVFESRPTAAPTLLLNNLRLDFCGPLHGASSAFCSIRTTNYRNYAERQVRSLYAVSAALGGIIPLVIASTIVATVSEELYSRIL